MKRLLLAIITAISLIPFFLSLANSLAEPQVQTNLELSQTNLLLTALAVKTEETETTAPLDLFLLGKDPYAIAQEAYESANDEMGKNLQKLEADLTKLETDSIAEKEENDLLKQDINQRKLLAETIKKETVNRQRLNLKLGLLKAQQGETDTAIKQWQEVVNFSAGGEDLIPVKETAQLLIDLWQKEPILQPQADVLIRQNLKGWFRDRALQQFYTLSGQKNELDQLQEREKIQGNQALLKLAFLSVIPILGGSLGLGLLLILLIQWLLKKDQSLLATNANQGWETPWDWEITWQVLAIGFLFLGQLGLPIILGFIHLDVSAFGLRGKAIYVLATYLAMTFGGLGVMYLSIKPFFPLRPDWFKFQWRSRWFLWGFGGYLIALPVVVLISLVNQQIWHGQGGSNPLLFLALEAQDKVVLAIFFFTASIAAPFYEEIMFRGFLLSSLTRYFPVSLSILLSSFLFAIAHLNLSEVLPLMGLGIILGIVYTRTRNLLTSMLLHGLWNSGTLASLFILGSG